MQPPVSPPDHERLWKQQTYRIVRRLRDLPLPLRRYLDNHMRHPVIRMPIYGMSDADGPFSAGCGFEANKPPRRLIFAGVGGEYCFLHYETGGRSHSFHVIVFHTVGEKVAFVGGKSFFEPFHSYAALKASPKARYFEKDEFIEWR